MLWYISLAIFLDIEAEADWLPSCRQYFYNDLVLNRFQSIIWANNGLVY